MRKTELAWAAGFFDGEGCTGRSSKRALGMRVSVSQRRIEPLERFRQVVGVGRIYGPGTRQCYQWVACSHSDVVTTIARLWPYLSLPKKEQIRRVVNDRKKALQDLHAKQVTTSQS